MEHWELALLNIGAMAFMTIIGYLIKRSIGQMDTNFKEVKDIVDSRIKDLDTKFLRIDEKFLRTDEKFLRIEEKIADLRADLPARYVSKDDFIREIRAINVSIEVVAQDVKQLLILSGKERGRVQPIQP